jgi:hypothetical protein
VVACPLRSLGVDMSLSDLASVGSLVSGLAVLGSLVLLFFQLQTSKVGRRIWRSSAPRSRNTHVRFRDGCECPLLALSGLAAEFGSAPNGGSTATPELHRPHGAR